MEESTIEGAGLFEIITGVLDTTQRAIFCHP